MRHLRKASIWLFGAALILVLGASPGRADELLFSGSGTWNGSAITGSFSATFTDVTGGVQMVLDSELSAPEKLDAGKVLYLNFNPAKVNLLSALSFTLQSNVGFATTGTFDVGANAFQADGDGSYDIQLSYNVKGNQQVFTNGMEQTYLISATSGTITASDFTNYLSQPPTGGNGPFLAAIHVQNSDSAGGSSWVAPTTATPEPASLGMAATAIVAFTGLAVRRRLRT